MNNLIPRDPQDDEISLADIFTFFTSEWPKIAAGAVVGLVFSLGWAYLSVQYKAEAVILNGNVSGNTDSNTNATRPSIEFLSWKHLHKALPELARREVALKKAKPEEAILYKRLSDPKWWEMNVAPNIAYSKEDRKYLAEKGAEGPAGPIILFFTMTDSAADKEIAEKTLVLAVRLFRTASTYWALREMTLNIDNSMSTTEIELIKAIGARKIEIDYLLKKAASYEALRKRYPNSATGNSRQIVDIREGGEKYLPLETQLVALNTDILDAKDTLARLHDRKKQRDITKEFLKQALPVLEAHTDGAALGNDLLRSIGELRKKLPPRDMMEQQTLNELESDVASILARFDHGLRVSAARHAWKVSNPLKWGTLGAFGGGVLMLLFAMIRFAWIRSKQISHTVDSSNPP